MNKAIIDSFKNRLYKILCDKEENKNWSLEQDNLLMDLSSFLLNDDETSDKFFILYSKISLLTFLSYKYFRKNIFECINILERFYE
jgi:hypothetical protein